MSDDGETTLALPGLEKLLKAMKPERSPHVRVGILGDKVAREAKGKSTINNAELGAIYEYNINPSRPGGSFLRVPIGDHLQEYMEKSGAFTDDALALVVKEGSLIPWLDKIGVLAEKIVQDAFSSAGFGKWRPSNMARKKNKQTLVETQRLRESITHEVKTG